MFRVPNTAQRLYSSAASELVAILHKHKGGSIDLRKKGAETRLVLNRPEKGNAFSGTMMIDLKEKVKEVNASDTGLLVVEGFGKEFCSGADFAIVQDIATPIHGNEVFDYMSSTLEAINNAPYISVAHVKGLCMGGGNEIAAACDLRAAHKDAKFGFLQSRMGVVPSWGLSNYLETIVGRSAALRLFAYAPVLTADEARKIGYVDFLYDNEDQFEEFATSLMHSGPVVAKAQKAILRAAASKSRADQVDVIRRVWGGEALKEAIRRQLEFLNNKE